MRNKYILLRHGETIYQAIKSDSLYTQSEQFTLPITKKGRRQIQIGAKKLKKRDIGFIYSSDFFRTKETAQIVAKELGLKIKFDKRLRDTNFGIFSGKTGKEYKEFFSSKKQRFSKKTPKGENWRDVKKRVKSFIKDIEKKHRNKVILIVSHADLLWLLAGFLKRLTEKELLKKRDKKDLWPDVGQFIEI